MQRHILKTKELLKIWLSLPNRPTEYDNYRVDFDIGLPEARPSYVIPPAMKSIKGYFQWNYRTQEWDIVIEF